MSGCQGSNKNIEAKIFFFMFGNLWWNLLIIAVASVKLAVGSQELSLVPYPFHQIRYWSCRRNRQLSMMSSTSNSSSWSISTRAGGEVVCSWLCSHPMVRGDWHGKCRESWALSVALADSLYHWASRWSYRAQVAWVPTFSLLGALTPYRRQARPCL